MAGHTTEKTLSNEQTEMRFNSTQTSFYLEAVSESTHSNANFLTKTISQLVSNVSKPFIAMSSVPSTPSSASTKATLSVNTRLASENLTESNPMLTSRVDPTSSHINKPTKANTIAAEFQSRKTASATAFVPNSSVAKLLSDEKTSKTFTSSTNNNTVTETYSNYELQSFSASDSVFSTNHSVFSSNNVMTTPSSVQDGLKTIFFTTDTNVMVDDATTSNGKKLKNVTEKHVFDETSSQVEIIRNKTESKNPENTSQVASTDGFNSEFSSVVGSSEVPVFTSAPYLSQTISSFDDVLTTFSTGSIGPTSKNSLLAIRSFTNSSTKNIDDEKFLTPAMNLTTPNWAINSFGSTLEQNPNKHMTYTSGNIEDFATTSSPYSMQTEEASENREESSGK